jgi:hypothetical protein
VGDDVKRLKALASEDARLKKRVADRDLEIEAIKAERTGSSRSDGAISRGTQYHARPVTDARVRFFKSASSPRYVSPAS